MLSKAIPIARISDGKVGFCKPDMLKLSFIILQLSVSLYV